MELFSEYPVGGCLPSSTDKLLIPTSPNLSSESHSLPFPSTFLLAPPFLFFVAHFFPSTLYKVMVFRAQFWVVLSSHPRVLSLGHLTPSMAFPIPSSAQASPESQTLRSTGYSLQLPVVSRTPTPHTYSRRRQCPGRSLARPYCPLLQLCA